MFGYWQPASELGWYTIKLPITYFVMQIGFIKCEILFIYLIFLIHFNGVETYCAFKMAVFVHRYALFLREKLYWLRSADHTFSNLLLVYCWSMYSKHYRWPDFVTYCRYIARLISTQPCLRCSKYLTSFHR